VAVVPGVLGLRSLRKLGARYADSAMRDTLLGRTLLAIL
jgi:hypothetical protein